MSKNKTIRSSFEGFMERVFEEKIINITNESEVESIFFNGAMATLLLLMDEDGFISAESLQNIAQEVTNKVFETQNVTKNEEEIGYKTMGI